MLPLAVPSGSLEGIFSHNCSSTGINSFRLATCKSSACYSSKHEGVSEIEKTFESSERVRQAFLHLIKAFSHTRFRQGNDLTTVITEFSHGNFCPALAHSP
jgi:hypothetical protein